MAGYFCVWKKQNIFQTCLKIIADSLTSEGCRAIIELR